MPAPAIAIHGGAGRGEPRDDPAVHAALAEACTAAFEALVARGPLAAVEVAVAALEDCPLFNAGRGSVLTADATVECDAAIACGSSGAAGGVAAVRGVRNPIVLARAVMERTPHVLLAGAGAEAFARGVGVELVAPAWHVTERQRARWERWRERRGGGEPSLGTVGAVARDERGRLAAATSTGGVRGKLPGRVGDSPLIGAGTWAEDATCAVSATGDGEAIVRAAAAHDVSRLVAYRGRALADACELVARERVGGDIGLIALGPAGAPAFAANVPLFNRAARVGDAPVRTAIAAAAPLRPHTTQPSGEL